MAEIWTNFPKIQKNGQIKDLGPKRKIFKKDILIFKISPKRIKSLKKDGYEPWIFEKKIFLKMSGVLKAGGNPILTSDLTISSSDVDFWRQSHFFFWK